MAAYLADCAAAPWLDLRYHPTAAGALKVIFTRTKADKAAVREAFAELGGGDDEKEE